METYNKVYGFILIMRRVIFVNFSVNLTNFQDK